MFPSQQASKNLGIPRFHQHGTLAFFYIIYYARLSKECYSLSANISNDLNKILVELEKQISLEIQKMQKQNQYLQKEIPVLPQKINISFEHCKLQPDDICGPCLCSDDNKLLTKHYCNCQNLQPKCNCLQHKQVEIKVNELYKIHQNILQTVKV